MSRSLRHPLGGKSYVRPEKRRAPKPAKARQPRLRQSRLSVEGVLDAPETTASRPGLRLRIFGLIVLGLFALLGLRLWALTVLQAPAAAKTVTANQIRTVAVAPTRGLILDRYGNPLVNNVVTEQITLSRVAAQQHPEVIGRVAALIGETPAQVNADLNNSQYSQYKPVPVLSDAPLADVLYIKEHASEFPGVSSVATTQRNYPQQQLPGAAGTYPAAQALGYVGTINAAELKALQNQGYQAGDAFGQSGLENQYEQQLRGVPGSEQLEVDAQDQVVGTLKFTPPTPGDNLVTNIDTNLQQVADNALATQIAALKKTYDPQCQNAQQQTVGCYPAATGGAVVVMSPQTGAVYALSSYPSYNPSVWVGGISNAAYAQLNAPSSNYPLINRAIDGLYTPGSTFKLNTATAALQSGLISPSYTFVDTGTYTAPGCQYQSTTCTLHDASPSDAGTYDVAGAIAVSSDDFFYNLGAQFYLQAAKYGATPIQDQAAQYGLTSPTGIDLPGEVAGRVDSQAERQKLHAEAPNAFPTTTWYVGDQMEMAFGQGATVLTPIGQAVAYATFANGGTKYQPQVAAAVVSPSGKVVQRFAPKVVGHVAISPANHQAMLAGFEGAVTSPTGTAYGVPGLASFPGGVAGKTGTADTEIGKEPTAWFVGFGPTADPQYVVVCVIDQAGYGAQASAPVVGQIFSYLATHPVTAPAIPPTPAVVQSQCPVPLPGAAPTPCPASQGATTGPGTQGSTTTTVPGSGSTSSAG